MYIGYIPPILIIYNVYRLYPTYSYNIQCI